MATPTAQDFGPKSEQPYIGYELVVTVIVFMVLELACVLLRFLARHYSRAAWGLDDTFIIPSIVFCWGICILSLVMVYDCGVGYHADYIMATSLDTYISWAKSAVAVEEIYCIAVVFPKLSILAMYRRMFATKKSIRWLLYALMAIISANGAAGVITSLASCRPLATRWDPALGGDCIDVTSYWRFISLPNIITDVIMLAIPIPVVWKLHTTMAQKLSLTVLFLTGSIGLVSSIVRFRIFFDVEAFVDGTWASVNLMIWTSVEPGIYLIAACLPNFRPLWQRYRGDKMSTSYAKSGYGGSSRGGAGASHHAPLSRVHVTQSVNQSVADEPKSRYYELGERKDSPDYYNRAYAYASENRLPQ